MTCNGEFCVETAQNYLYFFRPTQTLCRPLDGVSLGPYMMMCGHNYFATFGKNDIDIDSFV